MLSSPYRTRRLVVALPAVTLGLGLVVTGTVLWHRPAAPSTPASAAAETMHLQVEQVPPPPPTKPTVLDPVPASSDPVAFARAVAVALLEWDTTTPVSRDGYVQRIIAVGDPSGVETPGLVADLAAYVPNDAAWAHLTVYATRQWLDVTGAVIPDQWASVLATTTPGALAEGTTAVTITGTRHRAGAWEGKPVTDRSAVSFTAFVVCEPTYPTCHLLRLGRLNHPMR
jgi:hypothetical protein